MFNSPVKTDWKLYLPKILPNDFNQTFSDYFFKETTMPYKDVHESFFESQILSFEIPSLGVETVSQIKGEGGEVSQLGPRFTHEKYGDTRLIVNIRCIDAYINFQLARYAFYVYTNPKTNQDPSKTGVVGDIVIHFNSYNSLFRYTLVYRNCIWMGVDGKEFAYDQTQQNFDQFGLVFRHNGFEIIPGINNDIAASKGLTIEVGDYDSNGNRISRRGINLRN